MQKYKLDQKHYGPLILNKTTFPIKKDRHTDKWKVFDGRDQVLGRLCSDVVSFIKGKHRPDYATHYSNAPNVIIINAQHIKLTGSKRQNKVYLTHPTMKPGQKTINIKRYLDGDVTRIVTYALKGMLPKNPLGYELLRRIRVFATDKHIHQAQIA